MCPMYGLDNFLYLKGLCVLIVVLSAATFDHAFVAAGTFAYHCKIHASMHGTVTVTP